MNFIKQIENALTSINQARFQDLINHLLHIQGNKFMGAPGSVVSKEKTSKGAPDSFFINEEKYVFVECTTQDKLSNTKTFFAKLQKDIEHCFDENKTGIKKEDIEKVILACTDKIGVDEYDKLKQIVRKYNSESEFEVFDIQNLPMHIYDFPGLSEQYLGVEIIKGEIYNLPDFLVKTTRGLQPSLINDFVAREDELKDSIECLNSVDILLLSGSAGVGKSKLGVKILEESKDDYIPIVIQSSAVPLWDDFVHLFQNNKNYIILFDDANKSVQNLAYLLNFIQKPKTNKLKVIITVRDYVKHQVFQQLKEIIYREIVVEKFTDEDIEKIIVKALPNLQYHYTIKKKIVEISKGNARVALMATYSVTPNSQTNYLNSPVLLYEKYFEKVSDEIEAFSKPIIFRTLAIVSFFGALNRNNEVLGITLKDRFNIDWDELWTTILELHRHEILDVHSNEIVKVSDQVLATYAFYKCFIDSNSATIIYSEWISNFIESHPSRIKNTLIDANNTFGYYHIKDLVMPHLDDIILNENTDEKLYSFYSIFWFYKDFDALLYLKAWINELSIEDFNESLKFSFIHNDHTRPSKYFDLLINFWNHSNELLKPAIELSIELVAKQPYRLAEFLKFIHDYFSYKASDLDNGYKRQNIILDVLLAENRSQLHKEIAHGTFLSIGETLLGWHFTEFASKGISINILNFDLHNSTELLDLRKKILNGLYIFFTNDIEQSNKILNRIIFPGGKIDKHIYIEELPIYSKLVVDKLSIHQYSHCKFVNKLTKKIASLGQEIPDTWNKFNNSDTFQLAKLLKTDFLDDVNGKTWQEREEEKRRKIHAYIKSKSWKEIESLLYSIDSLYKQQKDREIWELEGGISEIYIGIAIKGKNEIKKAIALTLENRFSFQFQQRIIYFIMNNNIISGKELLTLVNKSNFKEKTFLQIAIFECKPENQIDKNDIQTLISIFKNNDNVYIHKMTDYLKFESMFNIHKNFTQNDDISKHNIISYLTEIILQRRPFKRLALGHHFFRDCASYFINHKYLFKQAFIALKQIDNHFDYDGKELEAVLSVDNNFFVEYLKQRAVDSNYLSFKFESFKLDCIWQLENYKETLFKALDIILNKAPVYSNFEHPSIILFNFDKTNEDVVERVLSFISEYIQLYHNDRQKIMMIMMTPLYKFPDKFIDFLKQFLLLNKNIEIFKHIWLEKSEVTMGSRVPYIQKEMTLCNEILDMVKTLPNILDYAQHINYLEQRIKWIKKDIYNEQQRDFIDYLG